MDSREAVAPMDTGSKRRGRPVPPDATPVTMKHIAFKLEEALAMEDQDRPNLLLVQDEHQRMPGEVSLLDRDGAVHILKFLRVWFDVPQHVFFLSAAYLDQFLALIKVPGKYLKCLTISCFHVAATSEGLHLDSKQLVTVSQTKCSVKDMLRMSDIVMEKVNKNSKDQISTSAEFVNIYFDILVYMAEQLHLQSVISTILKRETLLTRLEVVVSESTCSLYRPSIVALALIQNEVEKFIAQIIPEKSVFYFNEMVQVLAIIEKIHSFCQINSTQLIDCFNSIASVLKKYDEQRKAKHCQNLNWRFSTSTLALCHRNRNFQLDLDTIEEQNQIF